MVSGRSSPDGSTTHSSGGRAPIVAVTVTRPPPTARVWARTSPPASRTGSPAGRPVAGSTGNRQGCVRPRSVTSATTPSGPSQAGPGVCSPCQPVRSVSAQFPTGRSRSGARATAGTAAVRRPDEQAWGTGRRRSRDRPRRWRRSSGRPASRPGGSRDRPAQGSRVAPDGRRLSTSVAPPSPAAVTRTSQIDVRGRRSASSRGSATMAIARPSGRHANASTPQASDVSARGTAPSRRPRRTAAGAGRCSRSRPSGSRGWSPGEPGALRRGQRGPARARR